jgi:hypothetical protein
MIPSASRPGPNFNSLRELSVLGVSAVNVLRLRFTAAAQSTPEVSAERKTKWVHYPILRSSLSPTLYSKRQGESRALF